VRVEWEPNEPEEAVLHETVTAFAAAMRDRLDGELRNGGAHYLDADLRGLLVTELRAAAEKAGRGEAGAAVRVGLLAAALWNMAPAGGMAGGSDG